MTVKTTDFDVVVIVVVVVASVGEQKHFPLCPASSDIKSLLYCLSAPCCACMQLLYCASTVPHKGVMTVSKRTCFRLQLRYLWVSSTHELFRWSRNRPEGVTEPCFLVGALLTRPSGVKRSVCIPFTLQAIYQVVADINIDSRFAKSIRGTILCVNENIRISHAE